MQYVLILFLATSPSSQSGAASISQQFSSQQACESVGRALIKSAEDRGNYVLTWGCFAR